jgi:hypothetical protein
MTNGFQFALTALDILAELPQLHRPNARMGIDRFEVVAPFAVGLSIEHC